MEEQFLEQPNKKADASAESFPNAEMTEQEDAEKTLLTKFNRKATAKSAVALAFLNFFTGCSSLQKSKEIMRQHEAPTHITDTAPDMLEQAKPEAANPPTGEKADQKEKQEPQSEREFKEKFGEFSIGNNSRHIYFKMQSEKLQEIEKFEASVDDQSAQVVNEKNNRTFKWLKNEKDQDRLKKTHFVFRVKDLPPGEHSITITATDTNGKTYELQRDVFAGKEEIHDGILYEFSCTPGMVNDAEKQVLLSACKKWQAILPNNTRKFKKVIIDERANLSVGSNDGQGNIYFGTKLFEDTLFDADMLNQVIGHESIHSIRKLSMTPDANTPLCKEFRALFSECKRLGIATFFNESHFIQTEAVPNAGHAQDNSSELFASAYMVSELYKNQFNQKWESKATKGQWKLIQEVFQKVDELTKEAHQMSSKKKPPE